MQVCLILDALDLTQMMQQSQANMEGSSLDQVNCAVRSTLRLFAEDFSKAKS